MDLLPASRREFLWSAARTTASIALLPAGFAWPPSAPEPAPVLDFERPRALGQQRVLVRDGRGEEFAGRIVSARPRQSRPGERPTGQFSMLIRTGLRRPRPQGIHFARLRHADGVKLLKLVLLE